MAAIVGGTPTFRKDGRELFFVGPDRTVYAVSVTPRGSRLELGREEALFKLPVGSAGLDVTADGQRFVTVVAGEPDRTGLKVMVNPQ